MTQAPATHDRYVSDFRALESAKAPAWLRQLRRQALARFQELGFPTARRGNEPWKYTNVAHIASTAFAYADALEPEERALRSVMPWDDGWARIVFVNGRYSPALSSLPGVDGVRVSSLAEAAATDGELLKEHLSRHAPFRDDGFTALNTAFLRDGALVHLTEGAALAEPLHVVYVAAGSGEPFACYPRTLIVAEPNTGLTVIETYVGLGEPRYFTDAVTEIVVGDGAQVDHYRLLLEGSEAYHVGVSRVHQSRDSSFSSTSFASGSALGRNDFKVVLDGPGGSCALRGLYITAGRQHIDNYLNIDHAQPHTNSRMYYKGILGGRSRAVFGGVVLVRPGAVKVDAYQEDKNLLLSDQAEADSKPSLEIYADDVKCGHGATAGAVAEDAIFYMRSRGLDEKAATVFLVKGFANEVLEEVRLPALRSYLERLTLRKLSRIQQERAA